MITLKIGPHCDACDMNIDGCCALAIVGADSTTCALGECFLVPRNILRELWHYAMDHWDQSGPATDEHWPLRNLIEETLAGDEWDDAKDKPYKEER